MEKIQFKDLPDMTTPLSSANLNQMQDNMENAIVPIKLVSISDTAPESANIGDMYYNTTDNKIYTATAENTWDSGDTPRYDGFYINTNDNTLFYYDGNTLILSGGNLTDKNIKNEKTTSETDVYSCNYVNNITNKTIMKLNNATYLLTQTYTLEDDIEKYDFLYVVAGADSNYFKASMLIKVSDIVYNNTNNNHSYMLSNYTSAGHFAINFVFPSKTQIKILDRNNSGWGNPSITEVYGIKL